MTVVVLVADGARPDTLRAALDTGQLPTLARLRAEGGLHTVTSAFPSVTGPAYAPLLMGLFPGTAGLPGIRWWDRARSAARWPECARSYAGIGTRHADADLTPHHQTLFEHAKDALGSLTPIGRGLASARRLGFNWAFGARAAWTHFRGEGRAPGGRGRAMVRRTGERFTYEPVDGGDPLGLGGRVDAQIADAAHDACADSDYPDALVQLLQRAASPRSGEMILSAPRGWDFRARYEPIPHVSSHGALHHEHMEVPLLLNRPARAHRAAPPV